MVYQNYHKHSDFTNIIIPDSACTLEDYAKRAKELGHGILSSLEHGWTGNAFKTFEIANKYGLKLIYGSEAYFVKDRTQKDGTNCHICIFAKNEQGRRELNAALSEGNISGFYKVPRLDLQLLLSLSRQNIFLTTACVAFHKYDLDSTIDIIEQLHNHFEENFYLEVQYHKMELQQQVNKFLLGMSKKYEIPLIMGTDSHYIYPKDSKIRVDFLHSKNLYYENEEGCILDYPSTYEAIERFEKQKVLSENEIEQAINNTNVFLSFEGITFNKNIKLPTIYKGKTQEEKNKIFTDLIGVKWNKYKQNVPDTAIPKYEQEIQKEVDCVKNTGMADYFLLDYEIVERAKKKGGRITLTGRGSAAGFFTTTLLGFSKIDRLQAPVKMYPERFMSETRILQTRSLPDLDLNTGNPDIFLEAQDEILGAESSYLMIAFGKYKVKSAFKLYAKSQNIPFNVANTISQQIEAYELDYKHADDDMKDALDVYNYVDKEYHDIIRDSEKYQNLISDKKPAPCASLIYQGNIKEEIGLIKIKGKNGKKDVLVAAIDGNAAEDYKYLKNDLLKVDVVNIIYDTFQNIGQEPFSVNELIEITKNDKKVWDIYAKGLTVCLNQVEKESTKQKIMRYKPKNISELTSFIAAIRPSFQSMYSIYEKRDKFVYGIKAFDDLLQDEYMTSSFLLYQEQIMATLNYAGIDQSETYGIIKAIAKKKIDKIMKWKDIFINGFKKKVLETESISEEEALEKTMQVWKIIDDASAYGFNASHAFSVACDSLYCAYLKANYPFIFFETVLNYYAEKGDKEKISEIKKELESFKIKINPIKFREDNRQFKIINKNEMNESMVSIKFLNKQISNELYKLKNDIHFDFVDLLEDIKTKTGIQSNQLEVLIKLNYFEEFGLTQELLDYTNIFDKYWNKTNKCYRKQITKKKALKEELNIGIIERFSSSTDKTYTRLKPKQIIRENCRLVEKKDVALVEQLKAELDYLGYIRYKTDKKDRHKVFILDIQNADKNINPRIIIYSLGTGKIATLKIKKYLFGFKKYDIIHITKLEAKPKYMYLGEDKNGKQQFKKSTIHKEWWIERWIEN